MRVITLFGHILLIILLTTITQLGGLIWLLTLLLSKPINKKKRFIFPILYLVFNLIIIPITAPLFGRVPLPVFNNLIKPKNLIYPLLFRNYVSADLKFSLQKSSIDLAHVGIRVTYLDANFPFLDGFPLLPHLSHNDGKKVDISFQYKTKEGVTTNSKPSLSGYGIYTSPENKTSNYCKQQGYWQYDLTKYLGISTNRNLVFDKENTKTLIQSLLYRAEKAKVFIEPYLKKELGLSNYSNIRFHGCQAVRHDDHIHLQIK